MSLSLVLATVVFSIILPLHSSLFRFSLTARYISPSVNFLLRTSPRYITSRTSTRLNSSATHKMAELIDGNAIAAQIRIELKESVKVLNESLGATPGLAVILVGGRKDSATYVRMKKKACSEVGVQSFGFDYPAEVTEAELLAKIDELNEGTYSFYYCRLNSVN